MIKNLVCHISFAYHCTFTCLLKNFIFSMYFWHCLTSGFPGCSVGKEFACNAGEGILLEKSYPPDICWRRDRLPTPVFLGFPVAQLLKSLPTMWETWVQSLGTARPWILQWNTKDFTEHQHQGKPCSFQV